MSLGEFFLEIGCEEIPARFVADLSQQLRQKLGEFLEANRIGFDKTLLTSAFTPRRLVVVATSVESKQANFEQTIAGPPKKAAFNADGAPTQAAKSFAEKSGVLVDELVIVATAKGEYLAAKKMEKGLPATRILSQGLASLILSLNLPRSMYWASPLDPHFIRPIRWLSAVFNGKPLTFSLGEIQAKPFTWGHRILNPGRIKVTSFSGFIAALRHAHVILEPEKRKEKIQKEIKLLLSKFNAALIKNDKLLYTHQCLSEYPTVIAGSFDASFLKLPKEILVTVMRDHQKYFSMTDAQGNLLPKFLAVIDNVSDRKGYIRRSHERVLRARFEDAKFFWESDQKTALEGRISLLEKVVFQEKLGSYAAKAQRIQALAVEIARQTGMDVNRESLRTAAKLCKCDLTTQMVKEFSELQGIVGGLYANAQGLPADVAQAIYEHYRPETLESESPGNLLGAIISIADKMDTLTGSFLLGHRPTGSKDPFGLRRAGQGILKVILDKNISIDLIKILNNSIQWHVGLNPSLSPAPDLEEGLLEFFKDRIRFLLHDTLGIPMDEANAVIATDCLDTCDLRDRAQALSRVRKHENFDSIAMSFKRIKNIIRKSGISRDQLGREIKTDLFEQGEERELHAAVMDLKSRIGSLKEEKKYDHILELIARIRPMLDRFFDKVLVNAENDAVRKNRFGLISALYQEFIQIADFSELQPASPAKPNL